MNVESRHAALCAINSKSSFAAIFVADPHGIQNGRNEYLAIADPSAARGRGQCPDNLIGASVRNHQLQLHLWEQIHLVFLPAINLGVPLLAAMPAYFGYGHAVNSNAQ